MAQHKGFVYAVNAYEGAPLAGCVKDAMNDAKMLTHFDWREQDIRLLTDSRVDKDAWVERMEWLIAVEPGDKHLLRLLGPRLADRNAQSPR